MSAKRDQFGSKFGFIMASAGAAVGLGNIWRFPYVTGENGGAAFVLIYIALVFAIGLPLMLGEFVIGRRGKMDPISSLRKVGGNAFGPVGILGVSAALIILSFYGVIGGWTIKYMLLTLSSGLPADMEGAGTVFGNFIGTPGPVITFQLFFMVATVFIVARGVGEGIEKFCKIFMPILFILVLVLVARAVTLEGAGAGLEFYLKPDFSKVDGGTILAALGQAFFSLSLGFCGMITYGSYLQKKESMIAPAFQICFLDSLVAFIAGLVIFPAVFAFGFEPSAGPGLTFVTLPVVFAKMAGGTFFAFAFFALLAIASLTSSVSLLEIANSHLVDARKWSRAKAAIVLGIGVTLAGIPSAVSLGGNLNIAGKSFLDAMDFISSSVMMPINGLCIALLVGWKIHHIAKEELFDGSGKTISWFPVWRGICCVVAPIAIGWIFISGLR